MPSTFCTRPSSESREFCAAARLPWRPLSQCCTLVGSTRRVDQLLDAARRRRDGAGLAAARRAGGRSVAGATAVRGVLSAVHATGVERNKVAELKSSSTCWERAAMPVSGAAKPSTLAPSPATSEGDLSEGPVVRKQAPTKKGSEGGTEAEAAEGSAKAPAAAAAERPPVPKTRRPKLRMDGSSWLGASPSSKMAPSPALKVLAATRSPSPPRCKSLTRRNSTPRRRSPPAAADGDDEGDGGTPLVIDGSRPSLAARRLQPERGFDGRQLEVHVPRRCGRRRRWQPPLPAAPTEALFREQVSTPTKLLAASQSKLLERDGELPIREVGEVERLAAQLLPFTDAADAATPQLSAAPRAAWASDDDASSDELPPLCASLAGFRSALDLGRERAAERRRARRLRRRARAAAAAAPARRGGRGGLRGRRC